MSLALVNGNIITLDDAKPRCEALLSVNGKIAATGSNAEIKRQFPQDTEVLDLAGKTVVPGFNDAHTHFLYGAIMQKWTGLENTRSLTEALQKVKAAIPTAGDGWVVGVNFDESQWSEGRYPTRDDLDKVSRDVPVVFRRVCGHQAVVNSAAARELSDYGIDDNGVIVEEDAFRLAAKLSPTPKEMETILEEGQIRAFELGITSIHEIAGFDKFRVYQTLHKKGTLRLRTYFTTLMDKLDNLTSLGLKTQDGDAILKVGGAKLFADGSIGARTAALCEPFEDDPGNRGQLLVTPEELLEAFHRASDRGFQLMTHAIGDAALDLMLSGYSELLKDASGKNPLRHRVEHLEVAYPRHLKLMKELGLIASMQPNFAGNWSNPGGMNETRLGKERLKICNPYGSALKAGIVMPFGSDDMPSGPLYGIHSAANHPVSGERITAMDALRAYTQTSAHASFDEDVKGTLSKGKLADMVVLSGDITRVRNISALEVETTMLDGKFVYLKNGK